MDNDGRRGFGGVQVKSLGKRERVGGGIVSRLTLPLLGDDKDVTGGLRGDIIECQNLTLVEGADSSLSVKHS